MGAEGWCTLRSFVKWSACSHRSLAAGTRPTKRHHGAEGGALPLEQPWPGRSLTAPAASWQERAKMTRASSVVVVSGANGRSWLERTCCCGAVPRRRRTRTLLLWRAPATRALIEEHRARHYALFWPGLACTSGIAWSRLAKCSFEGVDTPFVEDF